MWYCFCFTSRVIFTKDFRMSYRFCPFWWVLISDDKMPEPVNPIQLSWQKLLIQGTACELYRQQFACRAGGVVWVWQLEGWVVVGYEQSCCPTIGRGGCRESPMVATYDLGISCKSGMWKFRDVISTPDSTGNFESLGTISDSKGIRDVILKNGMVICYICYGCQRLVMGHGANREHWPCRFPQRSSWVMCLCIWIGSISMGNFWNQISRKRRINNFLPAVKVSRANG